MEKLFLMTFLGCNVEVLELTMTLLDKFRQKYGHSKFIKVIQEFEPHIDADSIIYSFLLEVGFIVNASYSIDFDLLALDHDDSGYYFNMEYINHYLENQDVDDATKRQIIQELESWAVPFPES